MRRRNRYRQFGELGGELDDVNQGPLVLGHRFPRRCYRDRSCPVASRRGTVLPGHECAGERGGGHEKDRGESEGDREAVHRAGGLGSGGGGVGGEVGRDAGGGDGVEQGGA